MNRLRARILLDECTGRDIWSVNDCLEKGIPREWIEELADGFESGFRSDRQTIYYDSGSGERPVNQFEGVRDSDLARRLANFLGLDAASIIALAPTPEAEVRALQEAADE